MSNSHEDKNKGGREGQFLPPEEVIGAMRELVEQQKKALEVKTLEINSHQTIEIRKADNDKEVQLARIDFSKSAHAEETKKLEMLIKAQRPNDHRKMIALIISATLVILMVVGAFALLVINHPYATTVFTSTLTFISGLAGGFGFGAYLKQVKDSSDEG
ncbi:hypothetical protein [Leptospira stimsonii]|uniref:DUF2335 domain-containing protein n=1 Tax=Leptospira stimsonii TaxID=2202203 RepID=A0ABY2N584_9LEPT|nr:hypothetical protein [Leptospira stimsonii]TGK10389.1 hypothetical protein EHO98_23040 [Leptospira stimsonii]TGM17267.1 hypothetical protein EHQ90_07755 [Leptospira stimsonii]